MMKPAIRTIGTSLSLVTMASLVLTACSSGDNDSGKIKLQVPDAAIWGEESSALQVMYDKFEKDHPDIKLEQVTMSDDQAMSAALAAGKAPDLILMDPSQAKERYKSGYVEPIDRYFEKYGWGDNMFAWAKNAYFEDGKQIGVPWNYEGIILVYNKSMFEENGWKVPANYNDLMALAPQMQDKGIIPFAWGSSDAPGVDDWWVTSIVNSILGKEGTKQLYSGEIKWTDPAIVDGIQRYSDFWNAGYVSDKKSQAISQEDGNQLFLNAKAAMRLDGTWSLAADNDPDFDIGFAPFPSWKPDGEPIIPLGVGGGLVINAKSEHKDEVGELLNYFFDSEVVKTMAEHGIPEPIQTDYSQFDLKPNVASALNLITEQEKAGKTGYVAWSYAPPSVVQVLESDFASVYLKKTTVADWLDNLQKLKEKDIADNRQFALDKF